MHDIQGITQALAEVASTFPFSLEEIRGLELSFETLDGLFYWQEIAEKIADKIGDA